MSKIDINEIRARCDAATAGPWYYDGTHNEIQVPGSVDDFLLIVSTLREHPNEKITDKFGHSFNPDFAFIAHARQDIPALLDALETALNFKAVMQEEHDANDAKNF